MNITNYVIILNLIHVFKIALSCTRWMKREDYTGNFLTCCSTSCNPGFFVKVCTVNGTDDKCVPCPEGTYMDDATSSSLPQHCIRRECLPNSVPADSFPLNGCRKKCRCDTTNGYIGTDPCDCRKTTKNEDVLNRGSSQKPYTTRSAGSTPEVSRNVSLANSTTLKNDNGISDSTILTICAGTAGALLLILSILVIALCCIKRHRHRESDFSPTENTNTQIAQRPVALVRPNFATEVPNGTHLQSSNGHPPVNLGAVTNDESNTPLLGQIHLTSVNGLANDSYGEYLPPAPTIDPSSLEDQLDSYPTMDPSSLTEDSYPSAPSNDLSVTPSPQLQT
ncbi:uncharacterized protein LOC125683924 isoform X2 [Ostrea edulis]|uniref:uncharacterized protein LOC125683924 isoform X2 n=1 Tax=Ostrea edulis TaxID=37623 RepID=UPI0024AEE66D|nr:uncharacterized protein LOC125683924 isoform X2 [Ostrea edulis]